MNPSKFDGMTRNVHLTAQELSNPTVIEARLECLYRENVRLRAILANADGLRPALLRHQQYVPECVLDFCNQARAALKGE
jgi:hypothetical protein